MASVASSIRALSAVALFWPTATLAHPHVFIDATIEVIFDATGRAEALRIGWAYDALFSLTYISERGLDPDFDGVLTPEEQASLAGFDMGWQDGFAGDTYALIGETPLVLSGPSETSGRYSDGRLVSSHLRRIDPPVLPGTAEAPLVVQVYDPSFYTSYMIVQTPVLMNAPDCQVQVFEPDREAADEILQAALAELSGSPDVEAEFPAIGSAYAEEARITCAN